MIRPDLTNTQDETDVESWTDVAEHEVIALWIDLDEGRLHLTAREAALVGRKIKEMLCAIHDVREAAQRLAA